MINATSLSSSSPLPPLSTLSSLPFSPTLETQESTPSYNSDARVWNASSFSASRATVPTTSLAAVSTLGFDLALCSQRSRIPMRRRHNSTSVARPAWLLDPALFAVRRDLRISDTALDTASNTARRRMQCALQTARAMSIRQLRHVPRDDGVTSAYTVSPIDASSASDVVRTALFVSRIFRTDYELADALQAVADIARPGQQVATFVGQLYEASSDAGITHVQRTTLQVSGALFDVVSGVLPMMAHVKSIGAIAEIAAKALRNETIGANEMTNLLTLYRDMVQQRLTVFDPTVMSGGALAHSGAGEANKAVQPEDKAGTEIVDETRSGTLIKRYPMLAEKAVVKHMAEPAPAVIHDVLQGAPAPPLMQDIVNPVVHTAALALGLPVEEAVLEWEAQSSRAIVRPLRYALVDDIPFTSVVDASGVRLWRELPRDIYCESGRVMPPPGNSLEFTDHDQDYLMLEGEPYATINGPEGERAVYSRMNPTLPLIPVEKHQGEWRFKLLSVPVSMALPHSPDAVGLIRINNNKYIRINDHVYEARRVPINGELLVSAAAVPVMERLYSGSHIGIMRSSQFGQIIEGSEGYYPITPFGVVGARISLGEDGHALLVYDFVLERWRVVDIQRNDILPADHNRTPGRSALRLNNAERAIEARPSIDSLHSWSHLSTLPFYQKWPRLGEALEATFSHIASKHLQRTNRRPESPESDALNRDLDLIRAHTFRQLPSPADWKRMSITTKQGLAAKATKNYYENVVFWEIDERLPAFCSEMVDLTMMKLMSVLPKSTRFSAHGQADIGPIPFLQLSIRELPGPGRSHVALMAFDSIETMKAGFGDVLSAEPNLQTPLRVLDRNAFRDFVFEHREKILMIDPWGPEKIIDFSAHNVDVGLTDMMENLFAAGFGKTEQSDATGVRNGEVRYRVRALEPALSGLARVENS